MNHHLRITALRPLALAAALATVIVSPATHATNGYFAHGYGTKTKGMAGAGVGLSQDAMAAATNPAGMAFVGERGGWSGIFPGAAVSARHARIQPGERDG